MFDRGPIPRRDLWLGWPILRRKIDFYVVALVLPLLAAGGAVLFVGRFVANPARWQVIGAIVAGLVFGVYVFFELVRSGLNAARAKKILSSFDGVQTDRIHLRPITSEDGPTLPRVYDRVVLEANGLPADSPRREQAVLATGYWWGSSQTLTITDRDTGEILGFATLNGVAKDGMPEVGLSLGPWARGRGLAVETIGALGQALADGGYDRLRMGTRHNNWAMRRSLERAGATQTTETSYRLPNGEKVSSIWYVLVLGPTGPGRPEPDQERFGR